RKLLLTISLLVNLGLLAFFKYGNFLLENFIFLAAKVGIQYQPAPYDILLPIGISFYTFQTLTYTFDIYRRQLTPVKSFLDYALFVTYFPQLVAGPIVRASQFLPQCPEPPRVSRDQMAWGLCLLTLGMFQKVVIADSFFAKPADTVFGATESLVWLDAWVGTLAFSGQIFCDFAGYSTCAIGASLCLGFLIPNNFRYPYAAVGFSDFWRRWHISLSTWLRDYLYIGMGGNRKGRIRTAINLMMTMLIGGLWHGASWNFVIWGGLHGLYLWAEKALRSLFGHVRWVQTWWAEILFVIITNVLVCITWVFFRAENLASSWRMILSMVGQGGTDAIMLLPTADIVIVLAIYLAIVLVHYLLRKTTHEALVSATPWWLVAIIWSIMLVSIILCQGGGDAFIYFQF
ncbi:MAG: MBOAT family protein, partial [Candidatus Sumerlaeia bacterium]|nr:MBOAT family protein [Candidatus Sumerlaeia bacterium]